MDDIFNEPVVSELNERSLRLLGMMNDGIERLLGIERDLQRQLENIVNEQPLVRDYDRPQSPITQNEEDWVDGEIFFGNAAPIRRALSWSSQQTIPYTTPYYYNPHRDEDSDQETLEDNLWEDPYLSPEEDNDNDDGFDYNQW
jgi:hypothetical protein